ncbi:MAG: AarF/UbiB family protein, partial [Bacteroidales bacterium]|nr:AarF/UbiB family protein [Bacteroidales bacterium]
GDKKIHVPQTYAKYSTEKVLTLEYIDGISPAEVKVIQKKFDPDELAKNAAHLVLTQIFKHGFFHADPHPGNIRILKNGTICFLDYGMMGSIIPLWKKQLTNLLIGLAKRDAGQITDTILVLSKSTDFSFKNQLECDINEILDRFSYVSLQYLQLGELLQEILDIIFHYNLQFPAAFYLLSKAIATIEGIAREIDPEFNVIETIEPFAKGMIKERFSPKAITRSLGFSMAEFSLLAKELPGEARDILQQLRTGNTRIQFVHKGLDDFTKRTERSGNRLSFAIVLAALIIGSSLITISEIPPLWNGVSLIGITGYIFSGLLGFFLVISTWRHI